MAVKFNPFTGQLQIDEKGSGGGSSYIDGEVQNFSALPETAGTPPVDSAYLVREAEGAWLLNRKPAGIYIRTANTGVRASDWTYAGEFPDVFNDANFVLYDNGDSTKNLQFQLSGITTATTRTITVPDANITLDDAGDSRTPSSHSSSHASAGSDPLFDQDLNTADNVTFNEVTTDNNLTVGGDLIVNNAVSIGDNGIDFTSAGATATIGYLGLGTAATADIGTGAGEVAAGDHGHGNLTSDGKVGSTAGLPVVTTTAGAVTTLALGTAGQVLTVNSGANGVEFAAASGGGVSSVSSSASDVLGVSGSNITGVDANADRIIFFDDSAGKLTHLTVGSGLSISDTTISATASGGSKTYAVFTATDNQPPSTAFATLDTRNSIAVLDFDDATTESAVFVGIMPEGASLGSGLIVRIHFMGTTATSGDVRWSVAFERGNTDLDSDSFDTATAATVATSSTAGIPAVAAITCTNIDGITAGDMFRLRVQRIGGDGADTASGDMELVVCEVRSAA